MQKKKEKASEIYQSSVNQSNIIINLDIISSTRVYFHKWKYCFISTKLLSFNLLLSSF